MHFSILDKFILKLKQIHGIWTSTSLAGCTGKTQVTFARVVALGSIFQSGPRCKCQLTYLEALTLPKILEFLPASRHCICQQWPTEITISIGENLHNFESKHFQIWNHAIKTQTLTFCWFQRERALLDLWQPDSWDSQWEAKARAQSDSWRFAAAEGRSKVHEPVLPLIG